MKRKFGMIAAVVLLSSLTGVYADTITWTNTAGGSFQTAANWSPTNRIPGGLDTAEFKQSSASAYTVTLEDHVSVTNVTFPSGVYEMTLDLNGKTLTSASNGIVGVSSSTTAGNAINLTVTSSQSGGAFNLFQLDAFKGTVNSRGAISIEGSNTSVNVTNGSTSDNGLLYVGSNTSFTVSKGAHLAVKQTVLLGLGGLPFGRNQVPTVSPKAVMLITDPGTTYTNGTSALQKGIIVGKGGTNTPTLVVSNGASCRIHSTANFGSGGDTWYSYSPKANGKLVVTGTNSWVEANSISMSALAGEYGTPGSTAGGRVVVENGGTVTSQGGMQLSAGIIHYYPASGLNAGSETNANAYGEVIVRNPGSKMILAADVQVTAYANGAIYVLDGATLTSGTILYTSLGVLAQSTTAMGGGVIVTNQPAYTNDNAYGLFVVSNANSVALFKRVVFTHTAGYGDVVVADNARLSVTNTGTGCDILIKPRCKLTVSDAFAETQTLTTYSNSTVRIVLGARDHASAYIKTATLGLNAFSKLEVGVLPNAVLETGDTVTLLTYTGTRNGTFKDLPEGADFFADGYRFRIYYGDGSNDAVTLKYLPLGTMIRVL